MAQDKILAGYEQVVGAKLMAIVDHFGPTSYNSTTGDIYPATNMNRGGFDQVEGSVTFTGTYQVSVRYPNGYQGGGVPSVTMRWFYAPVASGVIGVSATAGTGQTNGTYIVNSTGGGGTGAQIQVIVAGAVITSATVINPGSGYTSVPTFTVPSGGTPGVVTATIGPASNVQVANGANLSAEAVRLKLIMY